LIAVVNHGRRAKTIETVGLKLRSGIHKHYIAKDSLTKGAQELTEGRSFKWMMHQDKIDTDDVEYVWVYDQTGKQFRGKLQKI